MNKRMTILHKKAKKMKGVLTAYEAIKWLESAFGKSMHHWRPETIKDRIHTLCLANGYEPLEGEMIAEINYWIEN